MAFEGLVQATDAAAGGWIAPRLHGFGGRVHCVVPDGYPSCARILHPAADDAGQPVPWAEVCRRTGRVAHALMQWNSIAEGRPGNEPVVGTSPRHRSPGCSTSWSAPRRPMPSASTRCGRAGGGCTPVPGGSWRPPTTTHRDRNRSPRPACRPRSSAGRRWSCPAATIWCSAGRCGPHSASATR